MTPPARATDGRWLPGGTSPNPGGRPRVIADVTALAREHTAAALHTLASIAGDAEQPAAARVAAANALLDRAYGKPPAAVAHLSLAGDLSILPSDVLLARLGALLEGEGLTLEADAEPVAGRRLGAG